MPNTTTLGQPSGADFERSSFRQTFRQPASAHAVSGQRLQNMHGQHLRCRHSCEGGCSVRIQRPNSPATNAGSAKASAACPCKRQPRKGAKRAALLANTHTSDISVTLNFNSKRTAISTAAVAPPVQRVLLGAQLALRVTGFAQLPPLSAMPAQVGLQQGRERACHERLGHQQGALQCQQHTHTDRQSKAGQSLSRDIDKQVPCRRTGAIGNCRKGRSTR